MAAFARVLLVGILALAAISIIGAAIAFIAPYLATLVVLGVIGKVLWNRLADKDFSE